MAMRLLPDVIITVASVATTQATAAAFAHPSLVSPHVLHLLHCWSQASPPLWLLACGSHAQLTEAVGSYAGGSRAAGSTTAGGGEATARQ